VDPALIHDWNTYTGPEFPQGRRIQVLDETLRDGLQNPSVRDPSISEKIEILHWMDGLGIDCLNIGLPGAGPRAFADSEALARSVVGDRLKIRMIFGGRTHRRDIEPMIEIVQRVGAPIETALFLGSSPIRRLVENWSLDHLLRTTEDAIRFAVASGLSVAYVTEDTTRTDPETVVALYSAAIRAGARAIIVCDTAGHATPRGVFNLVKFVIDSVVKPSGEKIRVDWHGHNDRGLAVANSLAAVAAGADQIHGCALGLGERVGNTPMEPLLINLRLLGLIDYDLSQLEKYSEAVSRATGVPIPRNYPVVGQDAFRTATGVHAAAIAKAYKKHDVQMADAVYSGVPAHLVGREQVIEIGAMSGRSNVVFWLEKHRISATDELVDRILAVAKNSSQVLTEQELLALAGSPANVKS
jgi:isopropylmalate/homocitrate/citramalate synthase